MYPNVTGVPVCARSCAGESECDASGHHFHYSAVMGGHGSGSGGVQAPQFVNANEAAAATARCTGGCPSANDVHEYEEWLLSRSLASWSWTMAAAAAGGGVGWTGGDWQESCESANYGHIIGLLVVPTVDRKGRLVFPQAVLSRLTRASFAEICPVCYKFTSTVYLYSIQ